MQAWRGEARQGIVAAASPAELPVSQVPSTFFASRQIGGSSQDQWLQLLLRVETQEDGGKGRLGGSVLRPAVLPDTATWLCVPVFSAHRSTSRLVSTFYTPTVRLH